MLNFTFITSFLVCIASTFVKGTFQHPRLVILAVAGLTGMYMVHLLAEDYNTYQSYNNRPGGRLLGKRSIRDEIFGIRTNATPALARELVDKWLTHDYYPVFAAVSATALFLVLQATIPWEVPIESAAKKDFSNHVARLDMILRFDPTGCARKYVCTIATKSSKKLKKFERNVMNMVRGITKKEKTSGGTAFKSAMELGKRTRDPEACGAEYPKCIFTASQMLRLMSWF